MSLSKNAAAALRMLRSVETGLPACYGRWEEFQADLYPGTLSWNAERMVGEIEELKASPEVQSLYPKILEVHGVDLQAEFEEAIRLSTLENI